MKRSPINPVSKKRRAVNDLRRKNLEKAWGPRPWSCQFFEYWALHFNQFTMPECFGPVNAHEIVKRSKDASVENLTNPEGMVPLCDHHNGWVEDHPISARQMGLSIKVAK
jgi:hypothetical protein